MLKYMTAVPALAAALGLAMGLPAAAHGHGHHYGQYAYADDQYLVDSQDVENDDESDVVSVASPVRSYVVTNDTIVTPYGYTPYYNNGYYQGYGYDPRYGYNPYYAAAQYSPVDPIAATVVTAIASAAQGGHVSGNELIQLLVSGILASQYQNQYPQYGYDPYGYNNGYNGYPQYPQYSQYPQYPQEYYSQNDPMQYVQQFVQYAQPQYEQPQYVQPQYVQPYYAQPRYVERRYVYPRYRHGHHGERDHDDEGGD